MYRVKCLHYATRLLSTEAAPTVKKTRAPRTKELKVPIDVVEHFTSSGQQDILEIFPPKILRKKRNYPDTFYIANRKTAETIAEYFTKPLTSTKILLESNPGPGFLTEHLARVSGAKLHLFEHNDTFEEKLKKIYSGQSKRIKFHHGDLVNMWKIAYRDRFDNGSRQQELLSGLPIKTWSSKPMRLFATVANMNFFKYLIYSLVRQSDIFAHGRFEMFLVVPPPVYIHLTCDKEAGYILYRANTILFQILFEYKFLTKLPRKDFLPWQYEQNIAKHQKLARFYAIDKDYLYLVKISPRPNIYDLCRLGDMQALVYFIKQSCVSQKHRVIPTLEKWAPGCGPRLIIQSEPSTDVQPMHRNIGNDIPKYSVPCTTMSNQNCYQHMNIFTEFGDLNPSELLTLFTQFRQWPEFKESPFLASLDNSLFKMETSDQESSDGLHLQEDEDFVIDETKSKLNDEKKSSS